MAAEIREQSNYSSRSPQELIRAKIETERLETIPLAHVKTEHALVDESHAKDLGNSMKQKRGQISPIVVRARMEDNEVVYDVIDGFHRTEGKKLNGDENINATVVYNCSDEEMFDLRILAASSVRSVQYPRIAQWISRSFDQTPWKEKGLNVAQAFGIAVNDSVKTRGIELNPEEIEDLKEWVQGKTQKWGKSIAGTYQILRVVSNADPDLVKQVRTSGGGKDRNGRITPARLQTVVEQFPGEKNFETQRAVLKVVVEKRLYAEETAQLVRDVQKHIQPGMSESEIYEVANNIVITHQVFPERDSQKDELGGWDASVDEFREKPHKKRTRASAKIIQAEVVEELRKHRDENKSLRKENESLKTKNAMLEDRLREQKAGTDTLGRLATRITEWIETATYLTKNERVCLERVFLMQENIDVVARSFNIAPMQVSKFIQSALYRKGVEELAKHNPYSSQTN